jgi:GNAT superfamily N-acetyltransferase
MTVLVRPATNSDGPELFRLLSMIRAHDSELDDRIRYRPVDEQTFLADWSVALGRPTSIAYVADEGGKITGFVTASVEQGHPAREPERHVTFGYLYVDPEHRRRGLGRRLFEAVCEWSQEHEGVQHAEMPVLAANDEAVGFWSALGFRPFIQRLWAPLPGSTDR